MTLKKKSNNEVKINSFYYSFYFLVSIAHQHAFYLRIVRMINRCVRAAVLLFYCFTAAFLACMPRNSIANNNFK